jgi:hypothetical protein
MPKLYQQNAPTSVIVKELEELFARDKIVERWIKIYIGILIFAILTFIGGIINFPYLVPVAIVILIFSIVQLVRYRRKDLEDRKLLTGLKLAQIIGVDLKKNSSLQLAISFEDYLKHGRALRGTSQLGKFFDTWFQAHGRLADNTVFDISVHQKVSRKERRKRKYTKVKEAFQEIVSLQLKPVAEDFPKLEQFPQAIRQQQQEAGRKMLPFDISRAEVRNGTVRLAAVTARYMKTSGRSNQETGKENLIDGDRLLMLLLATYAALRRCK